MIRMFVSHPNAANILMVVLLVLGIVSVGGIVRSTFPQSPLDTVLVTVPYPGASASEVDDAVCLRLEDAVDQVDQVEEYRCESRNNLASLTVEGRLGVQIDRLMSDVRTQIDAIDDLPVRSELPIIQLLGTTAPVVSIAIHGALTYTDLKDLAERTRSDLQRIEGVSRVVIEGFTDRQLRIELDALSLEGLGMSVVEVANLVRNLNVDVPAGDINTSGGTVSLRIEDERTSPAGLANLKLRSPHGGQDIRLGDIATITDTFEYPNQRIEFDGQPGVLLRVEKNRSDDALNVLAGVEAFVAERANADMSGVQFTLTQDIASLVKDRLSMLITNGVQGLILVTLVLWLFFSGRHALWVAMGLPVSFAGTFFLMAMLDYQFDMMTLVGLLIAIGIIVDDAIVVSENVAAQRELGKDVITASVDGTLEVLPGVVASFLTTACIFLPLAFLQGDIGNILKVVPVIMLLTLSVSLVEAFFILPSHLRHSAQAEEKSGTSSGAREGRLQQWLDRHLDRVRDRCINWVDSFVEYRYLGIGSLVGILLLSASLLASGIIGFTPLPELDNEYIEARLLMPSGTPITRTEQTVKLLLEELNTLNIELTPDQPGEQSLVRHIAVHYGKNTDAHETGDHVATIVVDLLSPEVRTLTSSEIRTLWREKVGDLSDVVFLKFTDPVIGPQGKPIEMRLVGSDPIKLQAAGNDLMTWLQDYRGVYDLSLDLRPGKLEYRYRLNPGAQQLGVTSAMIADQLRAAFNGVIVQEVQVENERFEVLVRLDERARLRFNTLDTFMVRSSRHGLVPLLNVADVIEDRGYGRLHRIDGERVVTLDGLIDAGATTSAAVITDTLSDFVPGWQEQYPGIRLVVRGESEQAGQTLGSIRRGFLLGFFGMFLLLALQFKSYVEPLVVVIIIPLSLIGVVFGHLLLGYNLTMPSMLGFVSLAGIVVNDSILLVTFVEKRLGEGMALRRAVVQASRDRFRAILLTSLTTVAGLLPLLLESSLQAKVVIPLAISLAFGLSTATLLVIFLIPAFYMVLHDFGLFHRHEELVAQPGL